MITLLSTIGFGDEPPQPEVRAQIDWQGHPAMHLTWRFFAPGLADRWPYLDHRHRFRQVASAPMLEASGTRIFLMAAMAAEKARDPEQARALILSQLRYVEDFVAAHPDGWALAKTPAEARRILAETDKRVVIHSIEGGHLLLSGPDDARFWADQGVALVTLMHLRDDELGGSAIVPLEAGPVAVGPLINRAGARARRRGERRGLTERGAEAVVELDRAGILVDLSHMTPETVDDTLRVTGAHGIPPVVTHGRLRRLHASELGLTDAQVVEVYRQGGVVSLGLPPQGLDPVGDEPVPEDVCRSTIELWRHHYEAVRSLVDANAATILGHPPSEADRTRLAVGWSSDWNGFTPHAAPVYGRGRCREAEIPEDPLLVDTRGLAHPGLLPGWWIRIERSGTSTEPMLRSAERFLQLWEEVREE